MLVWAIRTTSTETEISDIFERLSGISERHSRTLRDYVPRSERLHDLVQRRMSFRLRELWCLSKDLKDLKDEPRILLMNIYRTQQ